jgi:hypothetical protein
MSEKTSVSILVTPVFNLLGKKSLLYSLSDMSYGEWIIFENDEPKYYFNYFDEYYQPIRKQLDQSEEKNIESLLKKSFEIHGLNLSISQKKLAIRKDDKAYVQVYKLDKYPVEFLKI